MANKKITQFTEKKKNQLQADDCLLLANSSNNYKLYLRELSSNMKDCILEGVNVKSLNDTINNTDTGLTSVVATLTNDTIPTINSNIRATNTNTTTLSGYISALALYLNNDCTKPLTAGYTYNLALSVNGLSTYCKSIPTTEALTVLTTRVSGTELSIGEIGNFIKNHVYVKPDSESQAYGMVKVGYTTNSNNIALNVDNNGFAYVTLPGGTDSRVDALTEMSSCYAEYNTSTRGFDDKVGLIKKAVDKIAIFYDGAEAQEESEEGEEEPEEPDYPYDVKDGVLLSVILYVGKIAEYDFDLASALVGGDLYNLSGYVDNLALSVASISSTVAITTDEITCDAQELTATEVKNVNIDLTILSKNPCKELIIDYIDLLKTSTDITILEYLLLKIKRNTNYSYTINIVLKNSANLPCKTDQIIAHVAYKL